jgi:hypothetical protein
MTTDLRDALPAPDAPDTADADRTDPQHWFRDGAAPLDASLWWQLDQHAELVEALRSLCSGPAPLVQLRLWVFLELMAQPHARLSRDALNRHFHLLREEALELALRPLRAAGLLAWDAGTLEYEVTPLATQLMPLLAPLTHENDDDDELAGLLAQVAGAHQLGTLQPRQLRHLQAQLARLHDEFADAIESGSEFRLRRARDRHERVFELIERASQVLSAIVSAQEHPASLRLAREIGLAQARLLAMKSQFDRALHQAERQRVTLGSTGITTTDVRRWLQGLADAGALLGDALMRPVRPVFVLGHDLLDVTEAEFERERPHEVEPELPEAVSAPAGTLQALALPKDLGVLIDTLAAWQQADAEPAPREIADALHAGSRDPRYAAVAYRAQLMPLLSDPQAQDLKGSTGDLARLPWRARWLDRVAPTELPEVLAMSRGWLLHADAEAPVHEPLPLPPETEGLAPPQPLTLEPTPAAAPKRKAAKTTKATS